MNASYNWVDLLQVSSVQFLSCAVNKAQHIAYRRSVYLRVERQYSGSVPEWLACWTQSQKGLGSSRSRDAVE